MNENRDFVKNRKKSDGTPHDRNYFYTKKRQGSLRYGTIRPQEKEKFNYFAVIKIKEKTYHTAINTF